MNSSKKSLFVAIAAFAFLCVTLTSCDKKTCPTYSKTGETTTVSHRA